jgi:glycosidase
MHFTLRHLMLRTAAPPGAGTMRRTMIGQLVIDAGIEPMLKSWLYLDNHDTPRLATALPDVRQRRLAQVLQFTLPGSPNLYYGSELGMTGGDDPEMRAPMRWDVVRDDQPDLAYTRRLVALHQHHRALKVGNFRLLQAQHLIAFERSTDRAADTVLVLLNTSDAPVRETLLWPNSKVMDGTRLRDLLGGPEPIAERVMSALLEVTVPARSAMLLAPVTTPVGGYNNYKRVQ